MTDVDDRLRELFERKAGEVPAHLEVPRRLRARSRRRIAINATLAAIVVLGLGVGAVGGLRAVDRSGGVIPGASGATGTTGTTGSPAGGATTTAAASATGTSSPPAAAGSPCAAGQLRADARLEGAMGSRVGDVLVSNYSSTTCTLSGRPTVVLVDESGSPQPDASVDPTAPSWRVDDEPKPSGWPVVTLAPGGVASFRVRWANWCPDGRPAPLWAIEMPDGRIPVYATDALDPPPCLASGSGVTLEVGPFEPSAG
jgi:Domain of unknown function (DUF4232)